MGDLQAAAQLRSQIRIVFFRKGEGKLRMSVADEIPVIAGAGEPVIPVGGKRLICGHPGASQYPPITGSRSPITLRPLR